jgi:hypothetical protein
VPHARQRVLLQYSAPPRTTDPDRLSLRECADCGICEALCVICRRRYTWRWLLCGKSAAKPGAPRWGPLFCDPAVLLLQAARPHKTRRGGADPRNGQSGGTAYRIYPRSKRSIPSQRGGSREGRDIDVGSFLSDGHELIRGQF